MEMLKACSLRCIHQQLFRAIHYILFSYYNNTARRHLRCSLDMWIVKESKMVIYCNKTTVHCEANEIGKTTLYAFLIRLVELSHKLKRTGTHRHCQIYYSLSWRIKLDLCFTVAMSHGFLLGTSVSLLLVMSIETAVAFDLLLFLCIAWADENHTVWNCGFFLI